MGKEKKLVKASTSARGVAASEIVMSNEDLLTEILLRLPAKSLVRFKSVSKKWLNLISDSNFSSAHTRRSPNTYSSALYSLFRDSYSLFHSDSSSHPKLSFLEDVLPHARNLMIQDSCNGLLLCQSERLSTPYIVCNPTTQSYRLLPDHECFHGKNLLFCTWLDVCLVFDPSKSPYYNVVEVQFNSRRGKWSCEIEIYQSDSASWGQPLKFVLLSQWGGIYQHAAFCNGAIHWISEHGYHIWFDPNLKEMRGIKLSTRPRILAGRDIHFFGECDGRLFLIQSPDRSPKRFKVLEIGGDYYRWVAKYTVNLKGLLSNDYQIDDMYTNCWLDVLSIAKGGKGQELSLFLSLGGYVVSYGLESKTCLVLDELPDNDSSFRFPLFESLTPV